MPKTYQKSIRLEEIDLEKIRVINEKHKLKNLSEVIRFCIDYTFRGNNNEESKAET